MLPVTLSMNHKCTDNQFPFTFFLNYTCVAWSLLWDPCLFIYLSRKEQLTTFGQRVWVTEVITSYWFISKEVSLFLTHMYSHNVGIRSIVWTNEVTVNSLQMVEKYERQKRVTKLSNHHSNLQGMCVLCSKWFWVDCHFNQLKVGFCHKTHETVLSCYWTNVRRVNESPGG